MTNVYSLSKSLIIIFSFTYLFFSNIAFAGICDISGGSGIGGTGAPMHGSGIGGTGMPIQKNGSGIGGTGAIAYNFGIGSTGKPVQKNGSGIGGTGQSVQKTGFIVGTITGFGSICVNGIEIHYTSSTPLQLGGQTVDSNNSLAIGQVVAVGISGTGNEVTANEMHIIHAASGPVSMINVETGEIELLGQKIQLPFNIDRLNTLNSIQPGDYIDVSGLRDSNGDIVASRIDKVAMRPTISLRGPISSISNNSFNIEGIKINSPVPSGLSLGQEIHVSGQLDNDEIKPDNVMLSQEHRLKADIGGLVSIEGYINHSNNGLTTEIAGKVIQIPDVLQQKTGTITAEQKIIITGRLIENEVILMEHIRIDTPDSVDSETLSHSSETKNTDHQNETHDKDEHSDKHSFKPEELEHESPEHDDHEDLEQPDNDEQETLKLEDFESSEKSEHESPEIHEQEDSEVHEHEAPEAPEYEAPEAPEYQAPEVPEYEAPEVPEYEAPEVPEYEAPEVPEYEAPEVPEYEAPEVPEYEAPEIPEYEAPEVPEYEAPEVPEHEEHEH